jgi:branched-chain amino acid transport system ATP-binding protein
MAEPLLIVENLSAGYGDVRVLWDISLTVPAGEITCIVGSNGAGKSTLLRTISGLVPSSSGRMVFDGSDIVGLPADQILARGIVHVPEGRRLFRGLSVRDNLLLGAYLRKDDAQVKRDLDYIFSLFPILEERWRQDATTLSGGEQQMCAIARALMSGPKLVLLDEPSMGLAPVLVSQVFQLVRRIRSEGYTVLIVEQNVRQVLKVVDRAYLLEVGRIKAAGRSAELAASDDIRRAYMGI